MVPDNKFLDKFEANGIAGHSDVKRETLNKSEIDFLRTWLTNERKSSYTVKQYCSLFGLFLKFLGKPAKEASFEDIESFRSYLVNVKHYSKSSQCVTMMAVKAFYKSQMLPIPYNLTAPKRHRSNPSYLNETETASLLKQSMNDVREYAIVSVLAYTGIRVGELCRLDEEDCDISHKIIHIRHGKGDMDRTVIMSKECSKSLKKYLTIRNVSETNTNALFISKIGRKRLDSSTIQRIVRKLADRAGIKKRVTPHVLRHTFATSAFKRGANLRFLQEMLGHTSLSTTQIYMHLDLETMSRMYDRYIPNYIL